MQNLDFQLYIPLDTVKSIDEIRPDTMIADIQCEGMFRLSFEVVPSPQHVHSHIEVFGYDDSMGGEVIYQHRVTKALQGASTSVVFSTLYDELVRFTYSGVFPGFFDPLEKNNFRGTLVITDPSYIFQEAYTSSVRNRLYGNSVAENPIPWIHHYDVASTGGWRNWHCAVLRDHPEADLGTFSAKSGDIGIFLLEEIDKCRPRFRTWTGLYSKEVTIIPDFDGWAHVLQVKMPHGSIFSSVLGGGNLHFHSVRISKQ